MYSNQQHIAGYIYKTKSYWLWSEPAIEPWMLQSIGYSGYGSVVTAYQLGVILRLHNHCVDIKHQ